ncbi:sensor domain-containing diguanylate cyclase [Anaeromicropila populeti]|uniref:Diguanylate cyclase (GGDEF) domain-containing protein n=1 Tax=Anaeromicropila populeti TaxID=37658 RepID=A0A1I6KXW0_9FIRM|nr:sensor domain-containing diguanylate cyclase [Anaeromicropila populeti]SFR96044.1 diguanylate cyclase (GGDEF) domain-containing protein [Anaeromicropila populeti]
MDYNQVVLIQKRFFKFHRIVACFLILYTLQQYVASGGWCALAAMIYLFCSVFLEGVLLYVKHYYPKCMVVLKYINIWFGMFLAITTSNYYTFGICLLCLILLAMEYYVCVDFTDPYVRKLYFLSICIPLIAYILWYSLIGTIAEIRLILMVLVLGVFYGIVWQFAEIIAKVISENNETVYAQTRLIERINETNEELVVNQEKVKKANELLGEQKIKLEAAYTKINSVNMEMKIQNDILKYISSSLELSKLMTLITESIINRIGVDICAIVLHPDALSEEACNGRMVYKIKSKLSKKYIEELSEAIEDNCFEKIMINSVTYVDNYVNKKKYSFLEDGMIGSMLIVPLIRNSMQIGELFVGHRSYDFFIENTAFFEGIVAQFTIAMYNANLYEKMQLMAIQDGLTGIYNRRHLTALFEQYVNESLINRVPLSVCLFDIDHFKNVNDTYGHLFGDEVIRRIASLSKEIACKFNGVVGRYGGEEFVIIFPNKGLEEAYIPVSMLQQNVKKLGLQHNEKPVSVNVSVGLTSYPETCASPLELLNRADWAMYYSKQNGRDQITIDSDEIRQAVKLK